MMIFVNYGGGKYYFFKHSPWNGLTVADLVFPWFMWIMGVAMVFSIRSQLRRGISRTSIIGRIIQRSIMLFILGLFVNGMSSNFMPTFRIPGVLQRFAVCYFFTAVLEVFCVDVRDDRDESAWGLWWPVRDIVLSWVQWAVIIGMASIHTILTYVLPVPECPRGYIGPGGLHDYNAHPNCTGGAAAYIDKLIISPQHLYKGNTARLIYLNSGAHDPEGILGCLTAMLCVQFGVAVGRVLITHTAHKQRVIRFMSWGLTAGLFAGVLCDFSKEDGVVPVNKNLWSLSYVLTTVCFACCFFALIYYLVDWSDNWGGGPFRYAGLNPILLYVGHELTKHAFPFAWEPVGKTHGEYLLMNLWGTSLWVVIAYLCHLKQIYLSV